MVMGCDSTVLGPCRVQSDYDLYINYSNPTGTAPIITFDDAQSSPEIKVDFDQTFSGDSAGENLINVVIGNVRVIDEDNQNHEITEVLTYETALSGDCDWIEDSEFRMTSEVISNLDVMMVLDASESLGEDFPLVLQYAEEFAQEIFNTNTEARVGLTVFSDDVEVLPPTDQISEIQTFLAGVTQGRFTTLYSAIDTTIGVMLGSEAESRAIVVFTDGRDNNSPVDLTHTDLIDRVQASEDNVKISMFTIGLTGQGNLQESILEDLAINGGIAEFPTRTSQLEGVFERFSKSVANVYTLTYERNAQAISDLDPIQLRIVFRTDAK